ncbi:MAG: NfeD family protein [Bacilli bacterium]|nr:NfeD family protein [Bacilli bacterium]MBR1817836.1 NfeD family protein [Bacilli bacterium]
MNYWAMWLMVVILLTILEFATVNLVSVWFIASGILALILSLFVDSLAWQFGFFVVVGIILMICTKPLLDKLMNKDLEKLNLERVIGMPGIVTEEIKPGRIGEVKVDGKLWSATSSEELAVDTMILVEKMEGVKLNVVRNEPEETLLPQEIEAPLTEEEIKSNEDATKTPFVEESIVEPVLDSPETQEENPSLEKEKIELEESPISTELESPVVEEAKKTPMKNESSKPKNSSSKKKKQSKKSSSNKNKSKEKGVNK